MVNGSEKGNGNPGTPGRKSGRRLRWFSGALSPEETAAGMNAARRNAGRLAKDAKLMFEAGSFATAAALAILTVEENGTESILRGLSTAPAGKNRRDLWKDYRSHTSKNTGWILPELAANGAGDGPGRRARVHAGQPQATEPLHRLPRSRKLGRARTRRRPRAGAGAGRHGGGAGPVEGGDPRADGTLEQAHGARQGRVSGCHEGSAAELVCRYAASRTLGWRDGHGRGVHLRQGRLRRTDSGARTMVRNAGGCIERRVGAESEWALRD